MNTGWRLCVLVCWLIVGMIEGSISLQIAEASFAPFEEFDEQERETRHAEYVELVEEATNSYVACLRSEAGRLFGTDVGRCSAERAALGDLYPENFRGTILGCLDSLVLDIAAAGSATCPPFGNGQESDIGDGARWK